MRDVTLNDEELMREILASLIDDSSRQLVLLDAAIREHDADRTARLAHYSKGACANVGANVAAEALRSIELCAKGAEFAACSEPLAVFGREIEKLREEAGAFTSPIRPEDA